MQVSILEQSGKITWAWLRRKLLIYECEKRLLVPVGQVLRRLEIGIGLFD